MNIGDIVVRKSYGKDITFKIIDIKDDDGNLIYVLKGINIRILADSNKNDLEIVREQGESEQERILNSRVTMAIKNALDSRVKDDSNPFREIKTGRGKSKGGNKKELTFGRPGRILHVDGDVDYLDTCMKVYKQLSLEAYGRAISEKDQARYIVELVKEIKPDIVVLTGHDSVVKDPDDYLNLKNYRNTKYYIEAVKALREYNWSYDELIIFAGACQSCYEAILDSGANFASSPGRVLIHCLDPVFLCEKIAYTPIDKFISIKDAIDSTITGTKGVGGLQTRGKYREGYPKSSFL